MLNALWCTKQITNKDVICCYDPGYCFCWRISRNLSLREKGKGRWTDHPEKQSLHPVNRMWVWVNSGRWWWIGRPGILRFTGSQRVGHDWATELNWTDSVPVIYVSVFMTVYHTVLYRHFSKSIFCTLSLPFIISCADWWGKKKKKFLKKNLDPIYITCKVRILSRCHGRTG